MLKPSGDGALGIADRLESRQAIGAQQEFWNAFNLIPVFKRSCPPLQEKAWKLRAFGTQNAKGGSVGVFLRPFARVGESFV